MGPKNLLMQTRPHSPPRSLSPAAMPSTPEVHAISPAASSFQTIWTGGLPSSYGEHGGPRALACQRGESWLPPPLRSPWVAQPARDPRASSPPTHGASAHAPPQPLVMHARLQQAVEQGDETGVRAALRQGARPWWTLLFGSSQRTLGLRRCDGLYQVDKALTPSIFFMLVEAMWSATASYPGHTSQLQRACWGAAFLRGEAFVEALVRQGVPMGRHVRDHLTHLLALFPGCLAAAEALCEQQSYLRRHFLMASVSMDSMAFEVLLGQRHIYEIWEPQRETLVAQTVAFCCRASAPMTYARGLQRLALVLQRGGNVDAIKDGCQALHEAVFCQDDRLRDLLLAHGAVWDCALGQDPPAACRRQRATPATRPPKRLLQPRLQVPFHISWAQSDHSGPPRLAAYVLERWPFA